MISIIDHSELHLSLLIKCSKTNPVIFVQIGLIERDYLTIYSDFLEMLTLLGEDGGVVLELDEHHFVQGGEAGEVLFGLGVLFLVVDVWQEAGVPKVFVVVGVDATVAEVTGWS